MNTNKDQVPQYDKTTVKFRFFAQYWGQNVLHFKHDVHFSYVVNPPNMFGNEFNHQLDDAFLKLKSLSQISDDDIKQWAYLIFKSQFEIKEIYQNASDVWVIINENEVPFFIQPNDFNAMQIDYLRSKGYALPFMEYSVDDLVSFGWARIS